ncbi:MAG: molybdenum cofactor guanylyltransferase [Verrucomicrobia bacterium]|nr:molybdenum cofactor guanylyltransferase [Verrucomicrobiota bacterium]
MRFSAVLLAGGKSRRMGCDKALLHLPGDPRPLWQRQLDDVLRPLQPAEIFFSGRARPGLPADVILLADEITDCGPLAGIAAALRVMTTPWLVVLAVDLPAMTADFFRTRLLARCARNQGAVPQTTDGFFEPLAAVYPKNCLAEAEARLRVGADRSLQNFVRAAQSAGLIISERIAEVELGLFTNWNTLADTRAPLR